MKEYYIEFAGRGCAESDGEVIRVYTRGCDLQREDYQIPACRNEAFYVTDTEKNRETMTRHLSTVPRWKYFDHTALAGEVWEGEWFFQ